MCVEYESVCYVLWECSAYIKADFFRICGKALEIVTHTLKFEAYILVLAF